MNKYFVVIAKEYDYENGKDKIVGIFENEEIAKHIADSLTEEWNKREHISKWSYSFIVLSIEKLNVQYVKNTYELYSRFDKNSGEFVNTLPEENQ